MKPIPAFKSYDVRGRVGVDFDGDDAARIAVALLGIVGVGPIVLGRDARLSGDAILEAIGRALAAAGAEVVDLGVCATEEVASAVHRTDARGGLMITASHNPAEWNGLKLFGPGGGPLSAEDFSRLRRRAEAAAPSAFAAQARMADGNRLRSGYVAQILSAIDIMALPRLRALVDVGHGSAGAALLALRQGLREAGAPLEIFPLAAEPDGRFPHGVPNPLLPERRQRIATAIVEAGADLGVGLDGDGDRCFFFDETGAFLSGEHAVCLLAAVYLRAEPGAALVHDTRLVFAIEDEVARAGGRAVRARTGHAFLKREMKASGAPYGGELSGHHYFRDFMGADSGMVPWLSMLSLLGRTGSPLSTLAGRLRSRFPSSGEINFTVSDPAAVMNRVCDALAPEALEDDGFDGRALRFADWRFCLRPSRTEPYLRLTVETRGDARRLDSAIKDLTRRIAAHS
ncbi:MAG: phosphomannomutase/phosphoglucomutase [Rubricella sp.]